MLCSRFEKTIIPFSSTVTWDPQVSGSLSLFFLYHDKEANKQRGGSQPARPTWQRIAQRDGSVTMPADDRDSGG